MASPSKEEHLLKLILEDSPLKEWHFDELMKLAGTTRSVANKWLKKYQEDGLIVRVKPKGQFPYFIVGRNNAVYYAKKRLYALEKLHASGLISDLLSLDSVKTIIIFGSIINGDYYADSDIDIFVFGNPSKFNKQVYEQVLAKNIELHIFESDKEIRETKSGLIQNIVNGYVIKGRIQDFAKVTQ